MNRLKLMAFAAFAAGVLGAQAQSTNATRNGSHVLQGDFRADPAALPTFAENSGNSKRIGYGGATATARNNEPIWGLNLPPIPAGETLTAATLTADVTSISGSPLFFEVLASLMTNTSVSAFSAAPQDFYVMETAPLDTVLSNGIVFAQFSQSDVPVGGTLEIPVTGAALTHLNSLYDGSGIPTQSTVWFRLSTSVSNDPAAYQAGDRIQFADGDTNDTSVAAFGLTLSWAAAPAFTTDPVVKANVTWGTDYAGLSQTLDGSAIPSDGSSPIVYEKTGGPAWLMVAGNGALSGIADVVGTNEFPIKASIGDNIDTATLQIVVDPLGNPPVFATNLIAKADGIFGADYALQSQTLDGEATDPDLDSLTYSKVSGPAWLNVASNGALSGVCDVLGTNTFTVGVDDGNGNSDAATLNIIVQTLGSPPVFTTDPIIKADGKLYQDYASKSQTLAGEATDPDGDTLTYSKTGGPAWLNVASNGALSGVANVVGTNTFTVGVDDGNGNSDTATLQIYVQPATFGDLIVAIDTFNSSSAPTPTFSADGITASASASSPDGSWGISDAEARGSSKDGTWGTFDGNGNPASANTTLGVDCINLLNGRNGEITLTIENNGVSDINLGYIHFDALAFRPNAARTYAVNVLAGSSISTGTVFVSESQAITQLNGNLLTDDANPLTHDQHDDIDLDLSGLADSTLEVGGVAIIQLEFTGGTVGSLGHHLWLDNLGISFAVINDVEPPVLFIAPSGGGVQVFWTEAGFKLQSRPSLTAGSWTDYPGGGTSPVSVPATNDAEFLRLIQQ